MKSNPYAAIQSKYESFPKVSRRIADFILENPERVCSISIQQMARELDIAESSIIRFCKQIDCSGFSEMKLLLAKYAPQSIHTIFEDLSDYDITTIERVLEKEGFPNGIYVDDRIPKDGYISGGH